MDSGVALGGFEERIIGTVDGLALYARDYAPLLPETGLPVICLHGLTRNSRDFEVVAPRIAALGRRVVAPDMRGRGKSANDPDPAHYVPAVYAQDVLALMDRFEMPKAVFVGTSMGGLITMMLATVAPDRIAASVLNDVGPRLDAQGLARIASSPGRRTPGGSMTKRSGAPSPGARSANSRTGAFRPTMTRTSRWRSPTSTPTRRRRISRRCSPRSPPSRCFPYAAPSRTCSAKMSFR
jgi:pimeloyl-ACP methyl ester carboxylesterase